MFHVDLQSFSTWITHSSYRMLSMALALRIHSYSPREMFNNQNSEDFTVSTIL